MNSHFTYLIIDIATIILPFLFSFEKRIAYARQWRYLLPAMFITGAFFIVWDAIFTRLDVWGFNEQYILGVDVLNLPIEEWLFFVVVPYSCVFIYECLRLVGSGWKYADIGWRLFIVFGVILGVIGVMHYDKLYSFWCFLFCGLGCIGVYLIREKLTSMNVIAFWLMYFISFIPFFIVNGILTSKPVVIYNNAENFAVRLTTIPVEDFFYSLLLLLCNVAGMEYLRSRSVLKSHISPIL